MRCSPQKLYIYLTIIYFTYSLLSQFTLPEDLDSFDFRQNPKIRNVENTIMKKINRNEFIPALYIITPTYARWTQKAELIRISHSLALSFLSIHWVIIEDTKNGDVSEMLQNFRLSVEEKYPLIEVSLLVAATPDETKLGQNDPNWKYPRGVQQRNKGINFVIENYNNESAVLIFADDDNTYSPELFHEFVKIEKNRPIGVLPVGIVGGLLWEGPICKNDKVVSFHTAWKPERPFPLDMAGFAVHVSRVLETKPFFFSKIHKDGGGLLESDFLLKCLANDINVKGISTDTKKLQKEVWSKTRPLADNCSKILVWHTRTEKPKSKDEEKLNRMGKASPPLEV